MLALTQFILGEWNDATETARTDSMTPAAAGAALRAVEFAVRGGRGDTAVAEELERMRKWWDLDVMLPILGLQPAVDAYRQLDQPAEAEKLITDVSALCADIFQTEWFLARIRFATLGLQVLCHRAVGEPSAAEELVARGAELLASRAGDGGEGSAAWPVDGRGGAGLAGAAGVGVGAASMAGRDRPADA